MINLDFTGIPKREPLPEGVYEVVIAAVEETTSKTKGTPMLKVTFDELESKNRIWENYVLQENTLWKLRELLDAIGIDTSGALDFDPEDLVGVTLKAKIIQDEYNGEVTNRIKKVYAA